jgi:hypothetical protein
MLIITKNFIVLLENFVGARSIANFRILGLSFVDKCIFACVTTLQNIFVWLAPTKQWTMCKNEWPMDQNWYSFFGQAYCK